VGPVPTSVIAHDSCPTLCSSRQSLVILRSGYRSCRICVGVSRGGAPPIGPESQFRIATPPGGIELASRELIEGLLWRARAGIRVEGLSLRTGQGMADAAYRPAALP
jgi:hypothetical protein